MQRLESVSDTVSLQARLEQRFNLKSKERYGFVVLLLNALGRIVRSLVDCIPFLKSSLNQFKFELVGYNDQDGKIKFVDLSKLDKNIYSRFYRSYIRDLWVGNPFENSLQDNADNLGKFIRFYVNEQEAPKEEVSDEGLELESFSYEAVLAVLARNSIREEFGVY